jgi:hypothetical protein
MNKISEEQKGFSVFEIFLALIVLLMIVSIGVYIAQKHKDAPQIVRGEATKNCIPDDIKVPFGSSVSDGTSYMKLIRVIRNPITTGALPDPGTQYLEFDFSITTIPNTVDKSYIFNVDYNPAIAAQNWAQCGVQLGTIDLKYGEAINPVTGNNMPNKVVQVVGKRSIQSTLDNTGKSFTVQEYALFEVAKGDKGQVEWAGLDNKLFNFEY